MGVESRRRVGGASPFLFLRTSDILMLNPMSVMPLLGRHVRFRSKGNRILSSGFPEQPPLREFAIGGNSCTMSGTRVFRHCTFWLLLIALASRAAEGGDAVLPDRGPPTIH